MTNKRTTLTKNDTKQRTGEAACELASRLRSANLSVGVQNDKYRIALADGSEWLVSVAITADRKWVFQVEQLPGVVFEQAIPEPEKKD